MKHLFGVSVSSGIGIGDAFVYRTEYPVAPRFTIDEGQIQGELDRFRVAIQQVSTDLKHIHNATESSLGLHELLDTYLLMVNDRELHNAVEQRMRSEVVNVEWALHSIVQEQVTRLRRADTDYLRERVSDLYDVARRLLSRLLERETGSLADIEHPVVLVAYDLMPTDVISLDSDLIQGIALDSGGRTSHTAIIARSLAIPTVVGLKHALRSPLRGASIIVDGNRGEIIIEPDRESVRHYRLVQRYWQRRERQLSDFKQRVAVTTDGVRIAIEANIDTPKEVETALEKGIDGIGLFRSEFLFLQPGSVPDEESSSNPIARCCAPRGGRSVTIRTLDIGGDKIASNLDSFEEHNPLLGCRAIRYCLSNIDLFKVQLRALLRASLFGRLRIMYPMISGVEELERTYAIMDEVKDELRRKHIAFNEQIPTGVLIEVPSAAMTADLLASRTDFFSIGTNDLIQYTMAVDRGNERVTYLYTQFHPALLRLLMRVIEDAKRMNIAIAMCGEMAGDPMATLILLGLGLNDFSMSAGSILEMKRFICSVSMIEAREVVERVLKMESAREIDIFMQEYMERYSDEEIE